MSKTTKIVIAVIVVAAIALGVMMLVGNDSSSDNENTSNGSTSAESAASLTITYGDDGFSPATASVASGGKITFVNSTDAKIEPSSNPHPVHTDNPELNVGDIEPGASKTITVTTKGTWGFHNHYKTSNHATVTVE